MKRILVLLVLLVVGTQASAEYINGFTFSKPWSAQIFDQDENVEDGYKIDLGLLGSNSYRGVASLGISEYIFSDKIHKKIKIRAIHLPLYAPLEGENVIGLLGLNVALNYSAEAEPRDQQSEPTEDFQVQNGLFFIQGWDIQWIFKNGLAVKYTWGYLYYKYRNARGYEVFDGIRNQTLGLGYYFK